MKILRGFFVCPSRPPELLRFYVWASTRRDMRPSVEERRRGPSADRAAGISRQARYPVKNDIARTVALPPSAIKDFERWRELSFDLSPDAFVFPSEGNKGPGNKDSFWRHSIAPRLKKSGLVWVNFQVMRRTGQVWRLEQGLIRRYGPISWGTASP